MMGTTHKMGGFLFGLIVIAFGLYLPTLPISVFSIYAPIFLVGCVFGALFPDIDSPKSTISRMIWPIAWPIWIFQKVIRVIFSKKKSKFAKNICKTVGHRGIAHWLILGIIYLLIVAAISFMLKDVVDSKTTKGLSIYMLLYFFYGVTIGNISHIILDTFNTTGIPLFAPFSFKRIHFANVSTGSRKNKFGLNKFFTTSKSENLTIVIIMILICLLSCYILKFKV